MDKRVFPVKIDHFKNSLLDAQAWVYEVNLEKGWFDDDRTFGESVALLHSEVSEMLEAYREHGLDDVTPISQAGTLPVPKPEGVGSEAADVLIRLLDMCERYDIHLADEFMRKVLFNETRSMRHGEKRL